MDILSLEIAETQMGIIHGCGVNIVYLQNGIEIKQNKTK